MGNICREIETKKEMLKIKNTATEIKNTFDGLIRSLLWLSKELKNLKIRQ